jgi:hypothetical protein
MGRLKKLWEQAQKTGFPLEVDVIESLVERDWRIQSSASYFDDDEGGRPRELDIKATKMFDISHVLDFDKGLYRLEANLIIQCKQSTNRGWIFFPAPMMSDYISLESNDFIETNKRHSLFMDDPKRNPAHMRFFGLSKPLIHEAPLVSPRIAKQLKWLTGGVPFGIGEIMTLTELTFVKTGVSIGFDKSKPHKDLFEAAMTASKALINIKENMSLANHTAILVLYSQYLQPDPAFLLPINIFIPIIVFDGILCIWKGRETLPEEVSRLGYWFMNRSPNYFAQYLIPIVSAGEFDGFLSDLEKGFEKLAKKISMRKDFLDEQVQALLKSK